MMDIPNWFSPFALVLSLPILVFLAPRMIKSLVSAIIKYRKRSEKIALQNQIVEYRKELSTISQVDEFAKYSKLQRKLRVVSDQLQSITRQDFELHFKYVLIAQALAWIIAIMFCFRLVYHLYGAIMDYFVPYRVEREVM